MIRSVITFGAELPTPRDLGTVMEHLAGGWQVNGIFQAQTGFPFTVVDPNISIRYLTNRPNMICDPNDNAPNTVDEWFNTACFERRALPDMTRAAVDRVEHMGAAVARLVALRPEHEAVEDDALLALEQLGQRHPLGALIRADTLEAVILGHRAARRQRAAPGGGRLHLAG